MSVYQWILVKKREDRSGKCEDGKVESREKEVYLMEIDWKVMK